MQTCLWLFSSIHRRRLPLREKIVIPALPGAVICIVVRGEGTVKLDGDECAAKPLEAYLLGPGTEMECFSRSPDFEGYLLFFRELDVARCGGRWQAVETGTIRGFPRRSGKIGALGSIQDLDRLVRLKEEQHSSIESRFLTNARFQELLALLQANATVPYRQENEASNGIEQSVAYMHDRYRTKISLQTLAEIAGFTPTSYSREFKKLKGLSPIEYLNAYRIGQAKQMLMEKDRSVRDVCYENGFGNEFYFSRLFKREVGLAPTLYARRSELRIAVLSCLRFHETLRSLDIQPVYSANGHKPKTMSEEEHRKLLDECLNGVREARPELIVCDQYHHALLEQLKKIAPTVVFDPTMDWKANHRRMAELVEKEKIAERNINQLDKKLEAARRTIRIRFGDESVAFVRVVHRLIRIQGTIQHPLNDLLYEELGLKPGFAVPTYAMYTEFSPEKFPDLGSDRLFVQGHFYFQDDERLFRSIERSPVWHSMKAVVHDRVKYTPNWVGMSWYPEGRHQIIDALIQAE